MPDPLLCLGIESSCDETAASVLRMGREGRSEILSSIIADQTELHADFGGVVPEIAARAHAEKVDLCVQRALAESGVDLANLDLIAVTSGPGLIGGVMAGVMCAKGLSAASGVPLYGVNHLAGHALTPRLTNGVAYPYLMLLVSGGHCQYLIVHDPVTFERLGGTIDDAPGEAFDKVARLLGLLQPGGPSIEAVAKSGDAARFNFPRPLLQQKNLNLSFSGLKTAVLRARDALVAEQGGLRQRDQADIAASFQAAICDVLSNKTDAGLRLYLKLDPKAPSFCVAGGVAANQSINAALSRVAERHSARFIAPPLSLCTDNAAMIAFAGLEQMPYRRPDGLTLSARPRWPLDQSQPALMGSGKKGAKA